MTSEHAIPEYTHTNLTQREKSGETVKEGRA